MNEILITVFSFVLEMSFTAAVVVLAVCLIRAVLLGTRAPRKYAYLLWSVAAWRLMCPVSLPSTFSLFNLFGKRGPSASDTVGTPSLPPMPDASTPSFPMGDVAVPDVTVPPSTSVVDPSAGNGVTLPQIPSVEVTPPSTSAPIIPTTPDVSTVNVGEILWKVLAIVWLLGVTTFLTYALVRYIRLCRRVQTAIPMTVESYPAGAILPRRLRVYQCDTVCSPFVLGIFRPRLYIPFGLDDDTLRAVLAHETHHLRRFDHVTRPLSFVLLAVHWFNPAAWLAYILCGRDMETSCDEYVLRGDPACRTAYSTALLSFAANRRYAIPGPLAFGEVSVKRRIRHVLDWKQSRKWVRALAVVLCILTLVACVGDPVGADQNTEGEQESQLGSQEGNQQGEVNGNENPPLVNPPAGPRKEKGQILLRIMESKPSCPAIEGDCFYAYAYDLDHTLYRVRWSGTTDLAEGGEVVVDYDSVGQVPYPDGLPGGGMTPSYEITATAVSVGLPFPLPDFEVKRSSDGSISFVLGSVSDEAYHGYIEQLVTEGFTCIDRNDLHTCVDECYLLYKQNVMIKLYKSPYGCHMEYMMSYMGDSKKALSLDDILAMPSGSRLEKYGVLHSSAEDVSQMTKFFSRNPLYALETTPRKMYEKTGMRLYKVICDPDPYGNEPHSSGGGYYDTMFVIVGDTDIMVTDRWGGRHYADMDDDGICEVISLTAGYHSGPLSYILEVISMDNGKPICKGYRYIAWCGELSIESGEQLYVLEETSKEVKKYTFDIKDGMIQFYLNGELVHIGW